MIATSMQTTEINTVQLHEHPLHISTGMTENDIKLAYSEMRLMIRTHDNVHLFTPKRD